jgi:ATP-dependent Clp protease adaptor protein ClpS
MMEDFGAAGGQTRNQPRIRLKPVFGMVDAWFARSPSRFRFRAGSGRLTAMSSALAIPDIAEDVADKTSEQTERLYHVILLDDNDHTYEYVIEMLMELFGFNEQRAYEHTVEVDTKGHSRLATLPLEEAEGKRDLIHAYGPDWRLPRSAGSMASLIEPAA